MNVIIWHLRSSYVNIDEAIPYGQNIRTQAFLNVLTNILHELGHNVEVKIVRIAHPLRKIEVSKEDKDKYFLLHFYKSTIMYRGFLRFLRIISYKLLPNYIKEILNVLDSMIVLCKIRELKNILTNTKSKCINILVFDDIGSCHLFKDISTLKEDNNIIIYFPHNCYANLTGPFSNKIKKLEKKIIKFSDLIITSSSRDLELYKKLYGIKDERNIISFANVFPPVDPQYSIVRLVELLSIEKEKIPTIVLNIGAKVSEKHILTYLEEVSEAINDLEGIKILVIGENLVRYLRRFEWGNNEIEYMPYIPSRLEFIRQLSRAHIGINYAYKLMGTNVKRFDFALAGLVIISRHPGSRGELLPYEYVYVDAMDLKVKLRKLIECDLKKMGEENKTEAIKLAIESYENLRKELKVLMKGINKKIN